MDIVDTLHPESSPSDNLYPNIIASNIPSNAVSFEKLDASLRNTINNLQTDMLKKLNKSSSDGDDDEPKTLDITNLNGNLDIQAGYMDDSVTVSYTYALYSIKAEHVTSGQTTYNSHMYVRYNSIVFDVCTDGEPDFELNMDSTGMCVNDSILINESYVSPYSTSISADLGRSGGYNWNYIYANNISNGTKTTTIASIVDNVNGSIVTDVEWESLREGI